MICGTPLYSPHVLVSRICIISNQDKLFVFTRPFLRDSAFAAGALDSDFSPRLMGAYTTSRLVLCHHHPAAIYHRFAFSGRLPGVSPLFAAAYWPGWRKACRRMSKRPSVC